MAKLKEFLSSSEAYVEVLVGTNAKIKDKAAKILKITTYSSKLQACIELVNRRQREVPETLPW